MAFPNLKRVLVLAGVVFVAFAVSFLEPRKPRALAVGEVSRRILVMANARPESGGARESFAPTRAKTLFLRAGQFEVESDGVHRIRPVTGTLPPRVETHLVYNATRSFLASSNASTFRRQQ
jgi:hypothetical protein